MADKKHLFATQLKEMEKNHLERPEFIYRLHRHKYRTLRRIPVAYSWNLTQGWMLKGFMIYTVYYIFLKKNPFTHHWNREGYNNYDPGHHTWKSFTLNL